MRAALLEGALVQADLVRQLGVSQTSVNKWANARGPLLWPRWVSIALIAGVPAAWAPTQEQLHRAWEQWRDEFRRKGRPFRVAEPAAKKKAR